MIYHCLVALLCLFSASSTLAQLSVELDFEQETYLPKEPLYAVVRVSNTSGRTLELGRDPQWLSFTIEAVDGGVVHQKKPADVEGEFTLPSFSRAKKLVNIADAYDVSRFGRYIVRATVNIPEWNESFTSRAVPVGIATGVKLWETNFGVPSEEKAGRPEIRKFQLLSANHLKKLSLYVRVTGESEAQTFSLFPLGQLHGFSKPEPQVDRWSNLHVMYQDGAKTFCYNMITPDGLLLAKQTWEISGGSRPAMKVDSEGRINVIGGVRRVTEADLPPPNLFTEKAEPAPALSPADKPIDATKPAK